MKTVISFFTFALLLLVSTVSTATASLIATVESTYENIEKCNAAKKPLCLVIPGKHKGTTILTDGEGNPIGMEIRCKGRQNTCVTITVSTPSNYTLSVQDGGNILGTYNVAAYTEQQVTIEGDANSTLITGSY